jgi:hypothetical protein
VPRRMLNNEHLKKETEFLDLYKTRDSLREGGGRA